MSARYEAYSHRETLPAFKSVLSVGGFLGSFRLEGFLVVFFCFSCFWVFLTAEQGFAVAWTGLFLFYLTCPCQGLGFLSSGGERKMSLMSCAAEL